MKKNKFNVLRLIMVLMSSSVVVIFFLIVLFNNKDLIKLTGKNIFADTPPTIWNIERDATDSKLKFYLDTDIDNSKLVMTTDGKIGIGTTNPTANGLEIIRSGDPQLLITDPSYKGQIRLGTGSTYGYGAATAWSTLRPGYFQFYRSGGTVNAPSQLTGNTLIGLLSAWGYDEAASWREPADIAFWSEGTVTSTSSPGYIALRTSPSGSTTVAERMRITASGNVGIGTTNPTYQLQVNGMIRQDVNPTDLANYMGTGWQVFNGTATPKVGIMYRPGPANQDDLDISNYVAANIKLITSSTERMRINSSGWVGIGTTAPTSPSPYVSTIMEVDGGYLNFPHNGIAFNSYANSGTQGVANTDYAMIHGEHDAGTENSRLVLEINDNTNDAIVLRTQGCCGGPGIRDMVVVDNTKVSLVPSGGNVGIGTTNPQTKLEVVQSSDTALGSFRVTNSSGSRAIYLWADTNNMARIDSGYTGVDPIILNGEGNGNVGIGTTNPGSYKLYVNGSIYYSSGGLTGSDIRLKKNIEKMDNVLEKLDSINGVKFDWRSNEFPEKNLPKGRQIGVIAQDVEKQFPELVGTDNAGYKAVDYGKMTPVLLEAIKEQQEEIEDLKKEIKEIKDLIKNK